MTPKKIFFTKGVGVHKDKLSSFEVALRSAGIEKCNLVYVSSIFPPNCKIITRPAGLRLLSPGEITFCVMARNETNEPNRLISAAVGVAMPTDLQTMDISQNTMPLVRRPLSLGNTQKTLRLQCLQRRLVYHLTPTKPGINISRCIQASDHIFKTRHICQSAEGNKDGLWTTVLATAVFY